jgi:hypothetical protein
MKEKALRNAIAGFRHRGGPTPARVRRFRAAAIIPNAEARERFRAATTAHLFAIHVRLLIHRKRLTIHDCGLGR